VGSVVGLALGLSFGAAVGGAIGAAKGATTGILPAGASVGAAVMTSDGNGAIGALASGGTSSDDGGACSNDGALIGASGLVGGDGFLARGQLPHFHPVLSRNHCGDTRHPSTQTLLLSRMRWNLLPGKRRERHEWALGHEAPRAILVCRCWCNATSPPTGIGSSRGVACSEVGKRMFPARFWH
jgi:hypothetical protein